MLLIGPPGSGKTHYVLKHLEADIRGGRSSHSTLIVPTASMARHLSHTLARQGLVIPLNLIQTIRDFVRRLTPALLEPTPAANVWLIESAVQAANRKEFATINATTGLRHCIERTIREFQAAGCNASALQKLTKTPYQAAFASIFFNYEKLLQKHGYIDTAERLALAATEVHSCGLGQLHNIYIDGFFSFSHGERQLVNALAEHAHRVVITAWPDLNPGFPEFTQHHLQKLFRPVAKPLLIQAPSPEREVEEIARRIIKEQRPFGQIAVILRSPEIYRPLIRRTFDRFRIPFHLRIPESLDKDGTVRFLTRLLHCVSRGFPAEETLKTLSHSMCRVGLDPEMDAFNFQEQEKLRDASFKFLRARAKNYPVIRTQLDELSEIAPWRSETLEPKEWAKRCQRIARQLVRLPTVEDGQCISAVRELRRQAAALSSFDAAAVETAQLLQLSAAGSVRLREYLKAFDTILSQTLSEPVDQRRNVVHVLTIYEARQWELPLIFVCGLAENQFPRHYAEDHLFSNSDREKLRSFGFHLRTTKDLDQEELLLFRIATSRPTKKLIVTYPKSDNNGRTQLRSSFLNDLKEEEEAIPTVRLRKHYVARHRQRLTQIKSPGLVQAVVEKHDHFSPSSLEYFLQCPYQFFARRTLELEIHSPVRGQHIDPGLMGIIVHRSVAKWTGNPSQTISIIFNPIFDEVCKKAAVRQNFRTALIRTNMLRDLERFAREQLEHAKLESRESKIEEDFEYTVDDGKRSAFRITGRIDRYDVLENNVGLIVDYKYSGEGRIRKLASDHPLEANVQALIYLLGLEREKGIRPAGMRFLGLRNKTTVTGWINKDLLPSKAILRMDKRLTEAEFREMLTQGEDLIARTIDRIREGHLEIAPMDRDFCRRVCRFRDVCRIEL